MIEMVQKKSSWLAIHH